MAPGEKLPLVVTVTQPDGSVQVTQGEGHGRLPWKDLIVTATVASVDKNGSVSLPADPRLSDHLTPHLSVALKGHPDLHAELDIPVRYDHDFAARFYGQRGLKGIDGSDGSSDGSDGSNGSTGWPGGEGPAALVRVVLRPGPHPLLQIRVSAEGKDTFFLVDPDGGSLTVTSSGGPGGPGGRGGHGGVAGFGVNARVGADGHDGRQGADGRDGSILVAYDPSAAPYLATIYLPFKSGPAPIYREQASGSLW